MRKYIIGGVILLIGLMISLYILKENPFQKGNADVTLKEERVDKSPSSISQETLPPDIHPDQIVKVIDNHYAVVARPSLNVDFPNIPVNFKAEYRGILQWNETTKKWEKFLVVEDTDTKISQSNNPVDFWFEGKDDTDMVPHLLVVDINGAGSGEGLGKVLVPDNLGMDEWHVVDCFDYALDLGKGKSRNIQTKECQAVKVSLVKESVTVDPSATGGVSIYVESLVQSSKAIADANLGLDIVEYKPAQFTENNQVKTLFLSIPNNKITQFETVLAKEANDKIVYGAKALFGDFLEHERPKNGITNFEIKLIDVRLLK